MSGVIDSFIDSTVQCYGCSVFDRLFQIVSQAAAAVYGKFVILCMILFCVLFAFVIANMVWKNMRGGANPMAYQKSLKTLITNSLVALALLGMGVMVPRFVSTITFEPAANIALIYTQSMIQVDSETVNARVDYSPTPITDNGFFSADLRDTIIMLMKTTITQFQSYMKLGVAVMDTAFSWEALLSIGMLLKHIIIFFIGLYLFYSFFKLFVRFCFYFVDIIVEMAIFAFFFPFGLLMMSFKGSDAPAWVSNLGSRLGGGQIKKLINSIITLAAAVITYTVIMVIIGKFFAAFGTSSADVVQGILSGDEIFESGLSEDNLESMTLAGCVVLVYVLNYIFSQIPQVTQMIMKVFDVSENKSLSENVASQATGFIESQAKQIKNTIKNVFSAGKSSGGGTATGTGGGTP